MNPLQGIRIEFHILQSFPVTCLNRDDVGAPKSAVVGGVRRARVSSQCWKRQVRLSLRELGVHLAVRTKKVEELLADACRRAGATEEQALACGAAVAPLLTNDTLLFFTSSEADAIAAYAREQGFEPAKLEATRNGKKVLAKELAKVVRAALNPAVEGLDIALFGRMVAQAPELNIQAAASFAHAISTHLVTNEVEFFTALDDCQTEPGSAHMGSLEYNSATYYRYVSLDLGQLWDTLHGDDVDKAVAAFVKALYVAVPSARQTTQTGLRPWDYARVLVRRGQGMQVSFDKPVRDCDEGCLAPSITALDEALATQERLAGSLFGRIGGYVFGHGTKASPGEVQVANIDELASALARHATVGATA